MRLNGIALIALALIMPADATADTLFLRQGDTLPIIKESLVALSGAPIDLTGCTVTATMRAAGNTVNSFSDWPCVISAPAAGSFEFYWAETLTATSGLYFIQFTVITPTGRQTIPSSSNQAVQINERY